MKPAKRRSRFLPPLRREIAPEVQLEHINSAQSGSSSGNSTDSPIPGLALYSAEDTEESIVLEEVSHNKPEDNNKGDNDKDREPDPPDPPDPLDPLDPSDPPDIQPTPTMVVPPPPPSPTSKKSANFETDLEHLVVNIMLVKLTDHLALVIDYIGCRTFDNFCVLDKDDTNGLTFSTTAGHSPQIVQQECTTVDKKKAMRAVAYCAFRGVGMILQMLIVMIQ